MLALVAKRFAHHYGTLNAFNYPVTHEAAQQLWEHFLTHALPLFGDHKDAMALDQPYLFHARISAALNIGLLEIGTLCADVEATYLQGRAPLNAAEVFSCS